MIFREIEYNSQEWTKAVRLREKTLREPLGSIFSREELEEEKDHIQIAGFVGSELIATAVLVPEPGKIKMQRVAVLENLRNKNIGSQMMRFCEELSMTKGYNLIYCHARDSAVCFYAKNDYERDGDYFDEDGIPHLKMQKRL